MGRTTRRTVSIRLAGASPIWRRLLIVALLVGSVAAGVGGASASAKQSPPRQMQFSSAAQIKRASQQSPQSATDAISGPLRAPGGPFLYDRFGRIVTLHGVNAVYKRSPFELYPDPNKPWNFTAADAKAIAGLGFNVVRLGLLWQGLEPGTGGVNDQHTCASGTPGHTTMFNATLASRYLANLTRTVDLLGHYGVATLLDMHQDVYNQAFRGEGAPAWAVCTDGRPIVALGGRWSHNYRNPTLLIAETHFWLNNVVGNLQGQYDQMWSLVAHHFANNPYVVGYDPYNEPYSPELSTVGAHTFAMDLECFYTGRSHPGMLWTSTQRVHCPINDPKRGVISSIESADPHHLVFVEPDNYSVRHHLPSLLGRMNYPNLVYNFHAYCGFRSPRTGDPINLDVCSDQIIHNVSLRTADRLSMSTKDQPGGPPWFLSEFGATADAPLLDEVTQVANGIGLGWSYWSWKYYNDPTGSAHEALVSAKGRLHPTALVVSRPYAQAIAGKPVATSFDADDQSYALSYIASAHPKAPTVIYVDGPLQYRGGYCALTQGGRITSLPGARHLEIVARRAKAPVRVTITPRRCPRPS